MCGIIAYKGGQMVAIPFLLEGLARLEYRGYDSAGLAYFDSSGKLQVCKKTGKVSVVADCFKSHPAVSSMGLGHTRWATHGAPSDINAHPHFSANRRLVIVHNGIIENYSTLHKELVEKGYIFRSETDTEVLATFIESLWEECGSLEEAVRLALSQVIGAYAIVVMSEELPDTMIAACKGSPLVIGSANGAYYIASDAIPLAAHVKEVIYLEQGQVAVVHGAELSIKDLANVVQSPFVQELDLELTAIEKGGYEHFMLKEISTQPAALIDCMRGRLNEASGTVNLGGLTQHAARLKAANRVIIVACGTSWHAALIGEYLIEELCRIPVEVEYASEFRYRDPVIDSRDVVLAISQSGETADTLAAIDLAATKGCLILGLVNVVGSSIARATDAGIFLHAGPEIGVASTKAFTTQITVLLMLALDLGRLHQRVLPARARVLIGALQELPAQVQRVLDRADVVEKIAKKYQHATNFLYLGRGLHFPVALEGALKLKEISYIHAEGYPAAEMKHGPIALIDKHMPVVFLATKDASYEKVVSNIREIKSRHGQIIAVVTEQTPFVRELVDHIIEIPAVDPLLAPVLSVVPLQLLAYYIAKDRGCDVDQPRNLAKAVTVE